ncbi:unnamed protein product [Dracunculus medinensis]|uniref:Aromatic-L-amino-acid decarboxylase n=1 Tax=Dracunculus medinensis TaxID=318479 RepID=A0A158Q698_DRAME|nr:unnamed protein product [Dracunculus medinensis]
MLAAVRLRKLKSNRGGALDNYIITQNVLEAAIKEDRRNGLIPFILIATVGTTATCAVDPLDELGPICNKEGIWLHVDAAYAGSFNICPEYRYLFNGVEYADSININVHKSLLINFDCSPMFKNIKSLVKYFDVEALYLKHEYQTSVIDYRHLQIGLGRRFRSLKIWFVMRSLGIIGLQDYLRKMIEMAAYFEELINFDGVLELFVPRNLGLVCFRIKLLSKDDRIFLIPSSVDGNYFLRFAICSQITTKNDVKNAYQIIYDYATSIKQSSVFQMNLE